MSAVFVADGLAFLREFSAILLAVAENGDEAAGASEKAIDCPGGEDGTLAKLARPVQAEDAGGVVVEDGDLVRAKFHGPQRGRAVCGTGRICAEVVLWLQIVKGV